MGGAGNVSIIALFYLISKLAVRLECEAKGAPLAFLGADPDITAVGIDNRLAQEEAHTSAADLATVVVVAVELLEEVGYGGFRNAGAKVLDGGLHRSIMGDI